MSSGVPRRSSGFILAMRSISSSLLPLRKRSGGRRTGSDGVDRDRAAAHFLGHDAGQRFDGGLGGSVDAIGLKLEPDDAGREVDDPAAVTQTLAGFAQRVERTLQIDGDVPVEMARRLHRRSWRAA